MPNNKNFKADHKNQNRLKIISLFSLIAVLFLSILLGSFIFKFLGETSFFNISYIEITNRQALGNVSAKYFYDLIGAKSSIFDINLTRLKEKVEADFPKIEKLVITKVFPNRLIFKVVSRGVVAQVYLGKGKYCNIDADGFILPDLHPEPSRQTPVILGVINDWRLIKPNRKTSSGAVLYALSFIKEYKENNWLPSEHLVAVDVSQSSGLTIFLDDNLEIRILKNEIKDKMRILEGLLKEIRLNNPEVKCIDLRFKDVIINPKDDKNSKK